MSACLSVSLSVKDIRAKTNNNKLVNNAKVEEAINNYEKKCTHKHIHHSLNFNLTSPSCIQIVRTEINQLVDGQQQLESKFQSALENKASLQSKTKNSAKLRAAERDLNNVGGDLKNSTHVFGRSLRQNPLTGDNIQKIQEDR